MDLLSIGSRRVSVRTGVLPVKLYFISYQYIIIIVLDQDLQYLDEVAQKK